MLGYGGGQGGRLLEQQDGELGGQILFWQPAGMKILCPTTNLSGSSPGLAFMIASIDALKKWAIV